MQFIMNAKQVVTVALMLMGVVFSQVFAQCHNSHRSAQRTSHQTNYRSASQTSANPDIVELAAGAQNLSILVAAVKAAGLVSTLQGKGPFTVFAPTDQAFAALPEGTLEDLLKPENKKKLQKILTYHVVAGRIEANDLQNGQVKSVEGSNIKVQLTDGAVRINDALVRNADIRAKNGVVHVIDRVILPPNL
ncbi:MAG: fasciclin domain-containing protein [Bacteroidota bacterium]